MAYSDFKAADLATKFDVHFRAENLFSHAEPIAPSEWLREALARGQELGFSSEKSRSERLVTPILLEISNANKHQFTIYSGANLDVDEQAGLKGECDFIFSFSRIQDFITAPVFCITEAKKQDLELGTVQAAAQLIGAKKFNEQERSQIEVLYGASTTGIEWRFLKYENHEIIIDEKRYLISDLPELLAALQTIVTQAATALRVSS